MGSGVSKDKVGQLVKAGKERLDKDEQLADDRHAFMLKNTPEILDFVVERVLNCLESCSPFNEGDLMLAFKSDPVRIQNALSKMTRNVLSDPIDKREQTKWLWFKQYVLRSSVWFMRTADDQEHLYEVMMRIAGDLTENVNESMNRIFKHMTVHEDWDKVMAIKTEDVVTRQDDERVGLLREKCIVDLRHACLRERKADDEDEDGFERERDYVETSLAVTTLCSVAKNLNVPFQMATKKILSEFGEFRAGPIKKIERCISKVENDYNKEEFQFPRAAKLLDLLRCSVTCNTVDQMLKAYLKLMEFVKSDSSSMKLARVKNGFLPSAESTGYRDIKVNVIFESDDGLKMICEIQIIYGQILNEKKRSHRYYALTRERPFYDGVIQKELEDGTVLKPEEFEPVLNVKEDVETVLKPQDATSFRKCAVNSELKMLFMKPCTDWRNQHSGGDHLICVDMEEKKVVFDTPAYKDGGHTHHWLNINGCHFLSVQSSKNVIKFFAVGDDGKKFTENESLRLTLDDSDTINLCEFDKNAENVYLVKNEKILEQRSVSGDYGVVMSLELEQRVGGGGKNLCLSDDGKWGGIGTDFSHWVLIDTVNQQQFEMRSKVMTSSHAPCFIGGGSERIVVSGVRELEVWDVASRSSVQHITGLDGMGACAFSVGNVLAVGDMDQMVKLYDVTTWNVIYSQKYALYPFSLHLTADQKYLTVAGSEGELCVVIKLFD